MMERGQGLRNEMVDGVVMVDVWFSRGSPSSSCSDNGAVRISGGCGKSARSGLAAIASFLDHITSTPRYA